MLGDSADQIVGDPDVELARIAREDVDPEHPTHLITVGRPRQRHFNSGYGPFAALRVTPTRPLSPYRPLHRLPSRRAHPAHRTVAAAGHSSGTDQRTQFHDGLIEG